MPVTVVKTLAEFNEIIARDEPSVFDFSAEWCQPCKTIAPEYLKLSNSVEAVKFYKVDVEEALDIARKCNVSAMPTFIAFKSGENTAILRGAHEGKLRELVQAHALKAGL